MNKNSELKGPPKKHIERWKAHLKLHPRHLCISGSCLLWLKLTLVDCRDGSRSVIGGVGSFLNGGVGSADVFPWLDEAFQLGFHQETGRRGWWDILFFP